MFVLNRAVTVRGDGILTSSSTDPAPGVGVCGWSRAVKVVGEAFPATRRLEMVPAR